MKTIVFSLIWGLLSLSSLSASETNMLLKCLGAEELSLHKSKNTGPTYLLNQKMINEITGLSDVDIKKEYIDIVCYNNQSSSQTLMKEIMLKGKKVFKLNFDPEDPLVAYKTSLINAFIDEIPHIFFKFLSDVQSQVEYPFCLNEYIPEIKYFQNRYRYLEENLSSKQLIKDKSKVHSIFKNLNDLKKIFLKCSKRNKELKKHRSKFRS